MREESSEEYKQRLIHEETKKAIKDLDARAVEKIRHDTHVAAHKILMAEANKQDNERLLSAILDELIEIRKAIVKANKPKRKKK
jgi:hypothetical protein